MNNTPRRDKVLDVRGWSCPWIILKAKSLLEHMNAGQVLEVMSTDPEARKHFPSILKNGTDRVFQVVEAPGYFRLLIRRGHRTSKGAEHHPPG
ncbi:MAG: sulfurtransferase TusA family protein [Deltaproteobacteria bacterium]